MKQISEPRCLIRFYSVDNARSMKFAMIATPILLGISLVCVMGLGALVHGMTTEREAAFLVNNTDEVIGTMLAKCGSPLLSGICMAGLFAAGMSSLASVTLIVGTAFVGDMLRVFRPMSDAGVVTGTKWTMLAYCVIVFLIAVLRPAGIVELTAFSGAVFAASFFPAVFGGLYLRWGTGHGAFYSMLIGMVCCVGWLLFVRSRVPEMKDVHEIIPSFVVSLIAYLIISALTRGKTPPKDHLDRVFGA
jgi:Na+/proline symporter